MTRFRQSTYRPGNFGASTAPRWNTHTDNLAAFARARPEVAAWIERNHQTNEFAANCRAGIVRYGSPTDRMIAAVEAAIAREAARQQVQPGLPSYIRPRVTGIMLPGIMAAFASAVASGEVRRPRLFCVIDGTEVTLKLAGPNSQNPGAVYVHTVNGYCGKITAAGEWKGPESMNAALQAIDANPMEAARNYARFTAERDGTVGNCCCCGRLLTNPESVRLGIGPICGGRWGWL